MYNSYLCRLETANDLKKDVLIFSINLFYVDLLKIQGFKEVFLINILASFYRLSHYESVSKA